jgi:hypothetical protein
MKLIQIHQGEKIYGLEVPVDRRLTADFGPDCQVSA